MSIQNVKSAAAVVRGEMRPEGRTERRGDFARLLAGKTAGVRFSAHAESRLRSRNIDVTPDMRTKLDRAVDGAGRKGARESLVLLSNLAFIVNVPNRTVVTAMDGESARDRIFTNIDSTVIAG